MNARYCLKESPSDLGEHYGLRVTDNFPARYNIAPSQPVPVITSRQGQRHYELVRWGFVPSWDREGKFFKKPLVNIRSETAAEKPAFRHAYKRRRCLFPINGFYEWRTEKGVKQPYFLSLAEGAPLFSLAGLYEDWLGADGSEMRTAGFLTRPASGAAAQIHTRMPVVVAPQDYDRWIGADELDHESPKEILSQPAVDFIFWAVDRQVGTWKAEGAGLMAPIDGGALGQGRTGSLF